MGRAHRARVRGMPFPLPYYGPPSEKGSFPARSSGFLARSSGPPSGKGSFPARVSGPPIEKGSFLARASILITLPSEPPIRKGSFLARARVLVTRPSGPPFEKGICLVCHSAPPIENGSFTVRASSLLVQLSGPPFGGGSFTARASSLLTRCSVPPFSNGRSVRSAGELPAAAWRHSRRVQHLVLMESMSAAAPSRNVESSRRSVRCAHLQALPDSGYACRLSLVAAFLAAAKTGRPMPHSRRGGQMKRPSVMHCQALNHDLRRLGEHFSHRAYARPAKEALMESRWG